MFGSYNFDRDNPLCQPLIDKLRNQPYDAVLLDDQYNAVWASSTEAYRLLTTFLLQIPACETAEGMLLPLTHPVTLSTIVPPRSCSTVRTTHEGRTYYEITFMPTQPHDRVDVEDLFVLLAGFSSFAELQTSQLTHGLQALRNPSILNEPDRYQTALTQMESAVLALSNRLSHIREMQWYETVLDAGGAKFRVEYITEALFGFCEGVRIVLGNILEIMPSHIDTFLNAAVDLKRLEFVLLTALGTLYRATPAYNRFSFRAERQDNMIAMYLDLTPSDKPLPLDAIRILRRDEYDATCASDENLISQFCRVFDAKWEIERNVDLTRGILSLPYAEPTGTILEFHEPTDYTAERLRYFSTYPELLSSYFKSKYLLL